MENACKFFLLLIDASLAFPAAEELNIYINRDINVYVTSFGTKNAILSSNRFKLFTNQCWKEKCVFNF